MRYKRSAHAQYQRDVAKILITAWQDRVAISKAQEDLQIAFLVSLRFWMPRSKNPERKGQFDRRDLDNMIKILLDACFNTYLSIDDSRVWDIALSKRPLPPSEAGKVLLSINSMNICDLEQQGENGIEPLSSDTRRARHRQADGSFPSTKRLQYPIRG
jgi:Holliday junction resolvase RusA-like endonuclease